MQFIIYHIYMQKKLRSSLVFYRTVQVIAVFIIFISNMLKMSTIRQHTTYSIKPIDRATR